jgi:hypothetical protein
MSVDLLSRKLKKSRSAIEECLQTLEACGIIKTNHQGLWWLSGKAGPEEDLSIDAERFDESLSLLYDRSRQHRDTTAETRTEPKVLNGTRNSPSDTIPKVPNISDSSLSQELSSSATDVKVPSSEESGNYYSRGASRQREDRTAHVMLSGTGEEGSTIKKL